MAWGRKHTRILRSDFILKTPYFEALLFPVAWLLSVVAELHGSVWGTT